MTKNDDPTRPKYGAARCFKHNLLNTGESGGQSAFTWYSTYPTISRRLSEPTKIVAERVFIF